MNDQQVAAIVAHAPDAPTRRRSLAELGIVALVGALGGSSLGEARKSNKQDKALRRCKRQQGPCESSVIAYCAVFSDSAFCEGELLPCCKPLAACEAKEAMTCFIP